MAQSTPAMRVPVIGQRHLTLSYLLDSQQWYCGSVVLHCSVEEQEGFRLERKLTLVGEVYCALGHQWNWIGWVREFRNKRDKTGISEETSKTVSGSTLNEKARRDFSFCNPVNTSSVVRKTWNIRLLGNCHTTLVQLIYHTTGTPFIPGKTWLFKLMTFSGYFEFFPILAGLLVSFFILE